jgi:hypothetical protein
MSLPQGTRWGTTPERWPDTAETFDLRLRLVECQERCDVAVERLIDSGSDRLTARRACALIYKYSNACKALDRELRYRHQRGGHARGEGR